MKQPNERAAFRIKSTQVRTLVRIAVVAGESEVFAVVPSAMLSSNDLLDLIGEEPKNGSGTLCGRQQYSQR